MSLLRLSYLLIPLYLAQGLPGGIIAHALPAILREQGGSLVLIGFLKLLALPWLLKFLWAPIVDRHHNTSPFQMRRRWILVLQPLLALLLVVLGLLLVDDSDSTLIVMALVILLVNALAATQDIATDGLAVSHAPKPLLGAVNSIQVSGYKVGMILGGSGLLMLSTWFGWQVLFASLAVLLLLLLIPLWRMKEPALRETSGLHGQELSSAQVSIDAETKLKTSTTVNPFALLISFFKRSGGVAWLAVLLTYKLSDGLGSTMLKPMLIDLGWTLSEIGGLTIQSSLVGIVGALFGGLVYRVVGKNRALLGCLVLQIVAVSSFYFIANGMVGGSHIWGLVALEQFVDGMSTVALFACMMSHCRSEHEGSDYTLQASIQILLAGIVGAISGMVAAFLGYGGLYGLCALCGILSVVCVLVYSARAPSVRPAGSVDQVA